MPGALRLEKQAAELLGDLSVVAVGVDIVQIERIQRILTRHPERFARRLLVPSEWSRFVKAAEPSRHLAKQFAAKEAVAKALGTGIARGVTFQQLAVLRDVHGAPYVELSGVAARRCQWLGGHSVRISISDEEHCAVAMALVLA